MEKELVMHRDRALLQEDRTKSFQEIEEMKKMFFTEAERSNQLRILLKKKKVNLQ